MWTGERLVATRREHVLLLTNLALSSLTVTQICRHAGSATEILVVLACALASYLLVAEPLSNLMHRYFDPGFRPSDWSLPGLRQIGRFLERVAGDYALHHEKVGIITRQDFATVNSAGNHAFFPLLAALAVWSLVEPTPAAQVVALVTCNALLYSNFTHKLAHVPERCIREARTEGTLGMAGWHLVDAARQLRLLQSSATHRRHHAAPNGEAFGLLTGDSNRPVDWLIGKLRSLLQRRDSCFPAWQGAITLAETDQKTSR